MWINIIMVQNNSNIKFLVQARVVGVIGAVLAMAGGITCGLCVAIPSAEGMGLMLLIYEIGFDIAFTVLAIMIIGALSFLAAILAIVGVKLITKGTLAAPILLLIAGLLSISSILIINVIGAIGGLFIVIAAMLTFMSKIKTQHPIGAWIAFFVITLLSNVVAAFAFIDFFLNMLIGNQSLAVGIMFGAAALGTVFGVLALAQANHPAKKAFTIIAFVIGIVSIGIFIILLIAAFKLIGGMAGTAGGDIVKESFTNYGKQKTIIYNGKEVEVRGVGEYGKDVWIDKDGNRYS